MERSASLSLRAWRRRHPVLALAALLIAIGLMVGLAFALQDAAWDLLGRYRRMDAMPIPPVVLAGLLSLYTLLIAVPFMPGIEIGVALLMLNGAAIAPLVFLSTLAGLSLAYTLGHLVAEERLAGLFAASGLRKASRWIAAQAGRSPERRLALIRRRLPRRAGPFLLRYRYLWLALLVNLPGNAVVGGGGGLLLLAGLSRVFRPGPTLLTLALAVAPVPLAVWLMGQDVPL